MDTLSQYLFDEIARHVVYAGGTAAIMLMQTCKAWHNTFGRITKDNSDVVQILTSRSVPWLCREKKFFILARFCDPREVLRTQMMKLLHGSNSFDPRIACMSTIKMGGPEKTEGFLVRSFYSDIVSRYSIAINTTPTNLSTILYLAKDEDEAKAMIETLFSYDSPAAISENDWDIAIHRVVRLGWIKTMKWLLDVHDGFGEGRPILRRDIITRAETVESFRAAMEVTKTRGRPISKKDIFVACWRCKRGVDPISKAPPHYFARCASHLWKEMPDPMRFVIVCSGLPYDTLCFIATRASHRDNQELVASMIQKMPLYVRAGFVSEESLQSLYCSIESASCSDGMRKIAAAAKMKV